MATNNYQEFNKFQTAFYTNTVEFGDYSKFEVRRHGYVLLNNLAKGFPNLVNLIINLKGINWSAPESPAVLKALQRKFVNNFNVSRIPQFIYFKQTKVTKSKPKVRKTKHGLIFDMETQQDICSILKIDSKTYEYLKFSEKIQYLGKQLIGEFIQKEKMTKRRKK